jgi:hypothetical protein
MQSLLLDPSKGIYATVTSVRSINVNFPARGQRRKIEMLLIDSLGRIFRVSDVWVTRYKIKPLLDPNIIISSNTPIGQLLEFVGLYSWQGLVGKSIYLVPDRKNYFIPVAFDPHEINI